MMTKMTLLQGPSGSLARGASNSDSDKHLNLDSVKDPLDGRDGLEAAERTPSRMNDAPDVLQLVC
jgi:hypothetical protein